MEDAYILVHNDVALLASHTHQRALAANKHGLEGEDASSQNFLFSLVLVEDIPLLVDLNASYASAFHYCALVDESLLSDDKD